MTSSRASSRLGGLRGARYRSAPVFPAEPEPLAPGLEARMRARLTYLYGVERALRAWPELERLLRTHLAHETDEIRAQRLAFDPRERFSERDVALITYGDLIESPSLKPLDALEELALLLFRDLFSIIHILPFFPYSSDRGFAVISYEEVDQRLGTWEDVTALSSRYRLMFDGVFNHLSSHSRRFQRFLAGDPAYADFFHAFDSAEAITPEQLREITRPRTSPLLTPFETIQGRRWIWTTFSADQVDLNYANPRVLLDVVGILLEYVRRGADLVRLDAVTYLWRELGTSCAHLEQTHALVKLLRDVLDAVAPHVALVTETNVPHADNVTYFGDGGDEAQMIYNFALPPLVLDAFQRQDARALSRWAATIEPPSDETAFFNFLSSHDGIGLMGARGILPEAAIEAMCARAIEHGGFVSYKANGDGSQSPYEINITWFSALNREDGSEPVELQVDRFMASRAISLALRGVPAIYLPSFFGARNDRGAVARDGAPRSINRAAIQVERLYDALADARSIPARIAARMLELLEARVHEPAFHPRGAQRVLELHAQVFALLRTSPDGASRVLCLAHLGNEPLELELPLLALGFERGLARELLPRAAHAPTGGLHELERDPHVLRLAPYAVLWLHQGATRYAPMANAR